MAIFGKSTAVNDGVSMESVRSTQNSVVLVAGAGGFIGGHLARALTEAGVQVRGADVKPLHEWHQIPAGVEARQLDLASLGDCREAVDGVGEVYMLAADMGGMGFIETHKAECMLSVLISTHMLLAARDAQVERYFYSSSACVYAADKQTDANLTALTESDAYPAMPEDGYGWEKLFSERMCRHFLEDFGLQTRTARYHNVYGPQGSFEGGREKAPAALCRKVAQAVLSGRHEIEIWGNGEQTRSFTYIDDCVKGTLMVAAGDSATPVNIGSSELVTINQMVDIIEDIAGLRVKRHYKLDAPQGVRGRNSDNTFVQEIYGWEPSTRLVDGLQRTYGWVMGCLSGRMATEHEETLFSAVG
jgi:GDP-D-mannose 3',5'-epimerase